MNDRVHCPDCGAEYRAGYTICTECGGLLQPGATPEGFEEQRTDGGGERVAGVRFAYRADTDDASARASPSDLFEREERPPTRLILAVMVEEDAPGLIDALGAEGIGTRLGERTPDGGVEVLIHDTNLADRKSTRLNSSHMSISYAVFCLKKKKKNNEEVVSRNREMRGEETSD